jgi:hypothetical protein
VMSVVFNEVTFEHQIFKMLDLGSVTTNVPRCIACCTSILTLPLQCSASPADLSVPHHSHSFWVKGFVVRPWD